MSTLAPHATNQSASPFKWMTDVKSNTTISIPNPSNFKGKLPLSQTDEASKLSNIDKKLTHILSEDVLKTQGTYRSLKFPDAGIKSLDIPTGTRKRNIKNSSYEFNHQGERISKTSGNRSITERAFYTSTPMVKEKGLMFTKVGGRSSQDSWSDRIGSQGSRHLDR